MKVFYDSQIFGMQDYGGISRYFMEVVKRISVYGIKPILNITISHNDYIKQFGHIRYDSLFAKNNYRNYIYALINTLFDIPKIKYSDYDIFHPTYYETYFLPYLGKKPVVITVYDMVHELFSNDYASLSEGTIKAKKTLVERADHIIAISENTKKDIVNIYGRDPDDISVIYLGNSLKKWDGIKKLNLPQNYILFVGQRWIYKNFSNFIPAAAKVLHKYKDLNIICAGGGKFSQEEQLYIKQLNISEKITHVPFSSDRDLSEIYARATLFVYPSLYEGFGIPILEAFSSKTPIAISNTSCFPEIAGKAAIYFDPKNKTSIYRAIKKIVSDKKLQEKLTVLGIERLKLFSWKKTAQQTSKVYKKLQKL